MSVVDLAIVGGYGDVGRQAARHWLRLRSWSTARLRVGGRDKAASAALAEALRQEFAHTEVEVDFAAVDVFDESSLDAFAAGSQVLLNCAGPSHRIGDRIVQAAHRVGADHVDAAGNETLYEEWTNRSIDDSTRRVVIGAGMQPGLSGLLPRWLAAGMDRPRRLTSHIGLLDRFTATAADDFLQGGVDGSSVSLAAWRGEPRVRVLRRLDDQAVPGFPERVTLLPYLDREAERVAVSLRLAEGDWYSAVEGEKVMAAFERAQALPRDTAVAMLRQASAIDLGGRRPRVLMTMQLDAEEGSRSVLLEAPGNASLSGAFAAIVVDAVAQGRIAPGFHHAAEAMDPVATIDALRDLGVLQTLLLVDGPTSRLYDAEEGAL